MQKRMMDATIPRGGKFATLILLALVVPTGRQTLAEPVATRNTDSVVDPGELLFAEGPAGAVQKVTEHEAAEQKPAGSQAESSSTCDDRWMDFSTSGEDYHALRGDDAWLLSTRHLGCVAGKDPAAFDLHVSHYTDSGDWVDASLDELLASEPRLTVVYVHGNRIGADDAVHRAWDAFRVLQMDPGAPPMRLIIWSWPSDQIHGQLRDVRYKAARTNSEGHYLGWFLSQLDQEASLNLIGFSFGARVVTGALHVLSGGQLSCRPSVASPAPAGRRPIQVVLVAGALHNHWLSPGGLHEGFWRFADRLLVLFNSCDPVLKRYRFIEKHGRPVALGFRGSWGMDEAQSARTEERDVCCSVGKTHSEFAFFTSAEVIEGIQRHILARPAAAVGELIRVPRSSP